MYIPGRPQVDSFLYNRSRVSNMLPASSFYMALPSIFFPLQNVTQLSVKDLFSCFLSWALKLKKVRRRWMATYNTDDKREQCSNYNTFL